MSEVCSYLHCVFGAGLSVEFIFKLPLRSTCCLISAQSDQVQLCCLSRAPGPLVPPTAVVTPPARTPSAVHYANRLFAHQSYYADRPTTFHYSATEYSVLQRLIVCTSETNLD